MRLRYWLPLVLLVCAGVAVWQLTVWRSRPPEVPFARVTRETISSAVSTNGKVEPVEWAEARAGRAGAVTKILIQRGQRVDQNATLVELDSAEAKTELEAAQARIAQVRADLDVLAKGGRSTELAEIASAQASARQELQSAQKDYDELSRLQAKDAATRYQVTEAQQRVDQANLKLQSLEGKRAALVAPTDRASAEARLHEAEAAVQSAETRIAMSVVKAPIAGTVYQFDLKPGAYLNAGDVVAAIGRLERVHVNVFVDEPDLGRVAKEMPVIITWDALPGRQWKGSVDRLPTQIVPLGSRQVGEVVCVIENPNRDLLPGTNVSVTIQSEVVENALTIPKEAVQRQQSQAGVYLLNGDRLEWRAIKQGVNNATRAQVTELKDGDAVALPTEKALKNGMVVQPVYQ